MKKSLIAKSFVLATAGLTLVACNQETTPPPAVAQKSALSDFNEKIHVDNVQSDWESYGKFFEILN